MKKFLIKLFRFLLRKYLVSFLPTTLQKKIAQLGFPNFCLRDKKIDYVGKVFRSDFKIYATTNSTIEREATSYFIEKTEPILGMKNINFENFVCVDVGANIGSISLFMIYLKAKKVLAFEPGPSYEKLCKNIKLNNLNNKILPFKVGINIENDKFTWDEIGNYQNGYLKFLGNKSPHVDDKQIVEAVNLDEFLEKNGEKTIDLIKYDVEGMEYKAIMGSKKTIINNKPIVVAEIQEGSSKIFKYDCVNPIFELMYSLNYKSYFFYENKFNLFEFPEVSINDSFEVLYKKKIPNFMGDVFFIHQDKNYLIENK